MKQGSFLVGLALMACAAPVLQRRPPTSTVVAPVSTVAPLTERASSDTASSDPRPPCDVLRELAEQGLRTFPSDSEVRPREQPQCLEGKGGAYSFAWTFGYFVETGGYGDGYAATLELLHADARGRVAKSAGSHFEKSGLEADEVVLQGLADYDHDGVDELLVTNSQWIYEGNGYYSASIWRVAGEALQPYPPALNLRLAAFEDVDGDGIAEVRVQTPFQGVINECGPAGIEIEFGPKWWLHAQPDGSLSFDDVSRTQVKKLCPARPRLLVPHSKSGIDNDELRLRLACAVAWGVPSEAIVQQLRAGCPSPPPPNPNDATDCNYEGTLPNCANLQQLEAWAKVTPPFVLH